jgi:3-keto-L-gulonate-6-phosphate decarboxylase
LPFIDLSQLLKLIPALSRALLDLATASRASELAIAGGIEPAKSKIINAIETRALVLGRFERTNFLQATTERKRELSGMRGLLIEGSQRSF